LSARQNTGGATALPLARAFIAVGGRLMLNPDGGLEIGGLCSGPAPRHQSVKRGAAMSSRAAWLAGSATAASSARSERSWQSRESP
jgi:hypothetical protein